MRSELPPGQTWQELADHYKSVKHLHLRELFTQDPGRAERYGAELGPLYLDYSKNHLTDETVNLLTGLVSEYDLPAAIDRLYAGAICNPSEQRAALHTALRGGANNPHIEPEINKAVQAELARMTELHKRLLDGQWLGFSGKPINTIINIGIGGSDLGPRLLADALTDPGSSLQIDFVANIDPADISRVLMKYQPDRTLFIISSKSFTTLETRSNYQAARDWLHQAGCSESNFKRHFLAATANPEAAVNSGITSDNVFRFWDWVGGRYSVWSAAGLAAFLTIGPDRFRQFLAAAASADRHFREVPPPRNLPVMLALIGIWYINYHGCYSHAVVPYDQRLALLTDYLCQLVMESLGKSVTVDDEPVSWQTAPVTWGGIGTNSQHSFFQALHQGTQIVPVDFLAGLHNPYDINEQHADLFSSCLAQSRSLMTGAEHEQACRSYAGNRPSNTFIYETLSPETLGTLLAVYEHKTFTQAHLWNINPFDQWGVELGKHMARELSNKLHGQTAMAGDMDASTLQLLQRFRNSRNKRNS